MPSVSFYLKSPNKTGKEQLIYLFFYYGKSKPFKYSTGEKVLPENWDFKRQTVKNKRSVDYSLDIALILEKYENAIKTIHKRLLVNDPGEITDEILRYEMDIAFHRKERKKQLNLIEFFEWLAKEKEAIKANDRSAYKSVFGHLKGYQLAKNKKINYEDMTLDFLEKFVEYLEKQKSKYNRQYKKSTINSFIEKLKAGLDRALQEGYNTTLFYKSRNFTHGKERVVREPLTYDELMQMYHVDLSKHTQSWEHIRDTYMIGACTLLRHSDYSELKPEHIEDEYITRHTKKKGKTVILPTHWIIKEIKEKYKGKLPPKYSNTYMNEILPKIGELAGINKPVVLSYTQGGQRIEEVVPKYQIIKSHSARRTGATILKDENVPLTDIKELLTHENIQTTMNYLYVDLKEAADKVKNVPFFNKKGEL